MRSRGFITLLGGAAAAWPFRRGRSKRDARDRLSPQHTSAPFQNLVVAFGQGLKEEGFVEGQNAVVDYRYADNRMDRLPALVAVFNSPTGGGDRRRQHFGDRGQACDDDGADRLRDRRRRGEERHRRQSQPARR